MPYETHSTLNQKWWRWQTRSTRDRQDLSELHLHSTKSHQVRERNVLDRNAFVCGKALIEENSRWDRILSHIQHASIRPIDEAIHCNECTRKIHLQQRLSLPTICGQYLMHPPTHPQRIDDLLDCLSFLLSTHQLDQVADQQEDEVQKHRY